MILGASDPAQLAYAPAFQQTTGIPDHAFILIPGRDIGLFRGTVRHSLTLSARSVDIVLLTFGVPTHGHTT